VNAVFANKVVRRRAIAYATLLVISLGLMSVSANPFVHDLQDGIAFAFKPIQVAIRGVASEFSSIATTIAEIDTLRQENASLRAENDLLDAESRSAAELRRENEALTALLQLRNGLKYDARAVTVIARESSEARRAVVVDRGTDDGLAVGQVVIGAGGSLVGRVVEVGPTIAHVVLISDPTSTVTGQLLSTSATGKVVGQLGGALVMTDVDSAATVTRGEEVFTAGIELGGGLRSPYPKGLLIGRVIDVTIQANEVVQTVFLEPAAPLDRLEFLLVITNYEGGILGPIETGVPCDPTDEGTLPNSDQPCATDAPRGTAAP
jgi:rod shape-determining protein MreC